MKMKVMMDNTIRAVSSLTVRLLFSFSFSTVNRLAARLRTISTSRMAMMTLAKSMNVIRIIWPASLLNRDELSI